MRRVGFEFVIAVLQHGQLKSDAMGSLSPRDFAAITLRVLFGQPYCF
jgi:hypothetical protein